MNKGTKAYFACEGNLALSVTEPRLRVIEGGGRQGASPRRDSSHQKVASVAGQAKPSARQNPSARKRQAVCLMASLMLVTMIAVTWRVSDIVAQHRIDAALAQATFSTVTVMPGDSLWNIAERNPVEGCSTSDLVRCIRDVNEIDDACLQTGMRLSVPHSM